MKSKLVGNIDIAHKEITASTKEITMETDIKVPRHRWKKISPRIIRRGSFETEEVECGATIVWYVMWTGGLVEGEVSVLEPNSAILGRLFGTTEPMGPVVDPYYGVSQQLGPTLDPYYGSVHTNGAVLTPYYGYATSFEVVSSSSAPSS